MVLPMSEYELEALPEMEEEYEYEYEFEGELEGELEAEEMLRRLPGLLRRVAPRMMPVVSAMNRLSAPPTEVPRQLNDFVRAMRMQQQARAMSAQRRLPGRPQGEFEFEEEWESEINPMRRIYSDVPRGQVPNPIRRVYPQALMEHLGHAAAEAETEAEAEAFIGALIPLAARIIPRVAPAIMRSAPQLIRGVSGITRVLRQNPATRPLVRAVPSIVRRTAATMAQQASRGRPVTGRTAVRALAQQTANVLGNPQQSMRACRRSHALDRQYHNAIRANQVQRRQR